MIRTNNQTHQAERGGFSPEFGKEQASDIKTEIVRAFEVASIIEKAIRYKPSESLEQFLTRALNVLWDRVEESSLWIVPVADFLTPTGIYTKSHMVQIYTKRDDSGKMIGLSMPSLPHSEFSLAQECMRHFGFLPSKSSLGATEKRDLHGLDIRIVVNCACCLLKNIVSITAKNEILCWFDHTKNNGKYEKRMLQSVDDLADCLKSVIVHEPFKIDCVILAGNGDQALLAACRLPRRKIRLQLYDLTKLTLKKRSAMRDLLKSSGFIWRDDQDPSGNTQDWSGPESLELLIAIVRQILEVRGASLESNALQIGFLWQPFFS